ncbi:hypothetical protein KDU71_03820 [Carboxylicivirga sediminis]|uniref:Uncharacterized protein n=1 Tax=Carboxylicivirga sediminis TaxID=2006564 RepID=A0A941IVS4_9BACT|nr:hypothetical protein [Carboxylicivirga sediminis]MBR8534675.1 hypothetical protein [Carboxylicivirga sediminis]
MSTLKICHNCGKEFTPKRSDAICCSSKCRSALNYQKKQRLKQSTASINTINENDSSLDNLKVKGSLEVGYLIDKITRLESEINTIHQRINENIERKNGLMANSNLLLKEISRVKVTELYKVENLLSMSDVDLYNTFINKPYLEELRKGNEFAHNRLKTTADIDSKYNPTHKMLVSKFRLRQKQKLTEISSKVEQLEHEIAQNTQSIDDIHASSDELKLQLRFYENRIIKFESLLSV